jgi:hypothetical protein
VVDARRAVAEAEATAENLILNENDRGVGEERASERLTERLVREVQK